MIFQFRIDEFDDDSVGMYVCKVDVRGKQIEGYVKAQIYGQCIINFREVNSKRFAQLKDG